MSGRAPVQNAFAAGAEAAGGGGLVCRARSDDAGARSAWVKGHESDVPAKREGRRERPGVGSRLDEFGRGFDGGWRGRGADVPGDEAGDHGGREAVIFRENADGIAVLAGVAG